MCNSTGTVFMVDILTSASLEIDFRVDTSAPLQKLLLGWRYMHYFKVNVCRLRLGRCLFSSWKYMRSFTDYAKDRQICVLLPRQT